MAKTTRVALLVAGLIVVGVAAMGNNPCNPGPSGPGCDPADEAACLPQGVWNPNTCTCCVAGPHEVQDCELGQGGTFDWLECTCVLPCTFNSDCPFGEECGAGACVLSECHDGDPFDPAVPPRPCPPGQQCTFGDGVDLNHGNGWCQ